MKLKWGGSDPSAHYVSSTTPNNRFSGLQFFKVKKNDTWHTYNVFRRQSVISCVPVISSPKKWVGRSALKSSEKTALNLGSRSALESLEKMRSEHRSFCVERIIKHASCIMISVTYRGCKNNRIALFNAKNLWKIADRKPFNTGWSNRWLRMNVQNALKSIGKKSDRFPTFRLKSVGFLRQKVSRSDDANTT